MVGGQELVTERRATLLSKIQEFHPEFEEGRDLTAMYYSRKEEGEFNPSIVDDAQELIVWEELQREFYWRAIRELNEINETERQQRFSTEDLAQIKDLILDQIFRGTAPSSQVPIYHDVWDYLQSSDSPLPQATTEEVERAINVGFWNLLASSADEGIQRDALEELEIVLDYGKFLSLFDFDQGVGKAKEMPSGIWISRKPEVVGDYLRWWLIQDTAIYSQIENTSEAHELSSKLVSPLLTLALSDRDNTFDFLRPILKHYITTEMIVTPTMQSTLGNLFEEELERIIQCPRLLDEEDTQIERIARLIGDTQDRVEAVWQRVDNVNMANLPDFVIDNFAPIEYRQQGLGKLEDAVKGMARFDEQAYRAWERYPKQGVSTDQQQGNIKRGALKVYWEQPRRPAIDTLHTIRGITKGQEAEYKGWIHTTSAHLLLDFLCAKEWEPANAILHTYKAISERAFTRGTIGKKLRAGLDAYLAAHGQVKVNERGLHPQVCYPNFNLIPEFVEKNPQYFSVKSSQSS